jgi:hypothetical protein
MGQKTHPIGLRVGTHRKWASSWYNFEKSTYRKQQNSTASNGIINPRGGIYRNGVELFIEKLIKHKLFTNYKIIPQTIPVDFLFYKGYAGYTYGFFIYTKLLSIKKK